MPSVSDAWVKEPEGRGTWSLIQTCFLTLFLCTYTALHLNVPPHQRKTRAWLRRMGKSLLASALPEYMFVIAFSQLVVAKRLQRELNLLGNPGNDGRTACDRCGDHDSSKASEHTVTENDFPSNYSGDVSHADEDGMVVDDGPNQKSPRRSGTLSEAEQGLSRLDQDLHTSPAFIALGYPPNSSGSPAPRSKYTLGQAFFIVAGGLAIESKAFPKEARLIITPAGALELAKLRLLEPIPTDVIDDKTKADPITKLLVCIQAGWFILQSIARVSQSLPLTLIEIHVLAHVSVALTMYLFWFRKPYDTLSPFVITSQEVVDMAVLFSLHQPAISLGKDGKSTVDTEKDRSQDKHTMKCVLKDDLDTASLANVQLQEPTKIVHTHFERVLRRLKDTMKGVLKNDLETASHEYDQLQEPTQALHTHVERALRRLKANKQHLIYFNSSQRTVFYPSTNLVSKLSDYKSNPGFDLVSHETSTREEEHQRKPLYDLLPTNDSGLYSWTFVLFVSYGAFHLSAWNAHFPTTVERWLWRGAGLCIVGGLPLPALGAILVAPFLPIVQAKDSPNSILGKIWAKTWARIFVAPLVLMPYLLLYAFFLPMLISPVARLYFLIEAFISLRSPAPRTYDTVEWTRFWPHW